MDEKKYTIEQIHEKLRELFMESLSIEEIDDDGNFLDLGGDSLSIMNVIAKLEEEYHIELDPRNVLAEPTVNGVGDLIQIRLSKKKVKKYGQVNLNEEAKLDETIKPENEYTHDASESKNIFLTGSTGFLGAFLIKDLLDRNSEIKLFCHARCSDKYDGLERIMLNMRHYGCWDKSYKKRIEVIPGNLKRTHLGIDDEKWAELTKTIDAVYHNGAVLNFLYPYSAMKSSNVKSTQETLKLACEGKAKYYNYVSSYSVYDNPSHFGKLVMEDDPLESSAGYFLGYSETKWVAEKLVRAAQKRGLRIGIFRPGDITGTKETGVWEARDLTSRIIIGCIQMKVVPIISMPLNFTPVDYVSKAITEISRQDNYCGKAYNIINPEIGPTTELLKAIFACKKFVMPIPYATWKKHLNASPAGANALKILECMFEGDSAGDIISRHEANQPRYSMLNTTRALLGTGVKCPPMDASLLKSYINYFKKSGIV